MPLRYTGDRDIPGLNRWADDIENRLEDVDEIARKANLVSQDAVVLAEASGDIPPDPTSCTVSVAANIVDDVVYNLLTCTYTAPNPLGTFAGLFLVVGGYKGSTALVKVGESNYVGPAGGATSFKINLERTGETVTCYFVARTSTEVSRPDWVNAPARTAVLTAYPAIPIPSGITATPEALGIRLSWNEVTSSAHVTAYNVYRNTVNNSGTATKIATVPSSNGAGATGYFDKGAGVNTTYYYWISSVTSSDQESTLGGPVNNFGIGPGTHSSYRPLSNPITAHDAGASVTVNIAAFTMRIGGLDLAYSSGSVTLLSYSTIYYIYLNDPSFTGGAVSFLASTTKETILNSYGQLFVGSVRTPAAGGQDTVGNNDGGSGAQQGSLFIISPAYSIIPGNPAGIFANPTQLADGDTASFAVYGCPANGTRLNTGYVSGFPSFNYNWKFLSLNIRNSAATGAFTGGGAGPSTCTLRYSLDSGATFITLYSFTTPNQTRALTTDVISLAVTQSIPSVYIDIAVDCSLAGWAAGINIYEIWIEGQI